MFKQIVFIFFLFLGHLPIAHGAIIGLLSNETHNLVKITTYTDDEGPKFKIEQERGNSCGIRLYRHDGDGSEVLPDYRKSKNKKRPVIVFGLWHPYACYFSQKATLKNNFSQEFNLEKIFNANTNFKKYHKRFLKNKLGIALCLQEHRPGDHETTTVCHQLTYEMAKSKKPKVVYYNDFNE